MLIKSLTSYSVLIVAFLVGFSGDIFNPSNLIIEIPMVLITSIIIYVFYLSDKNTKHIQTNIENEIGTYKVIKSWGKISNSDVSKDGELLVLTTDLIIYKLLIQNRKVIEKRIVS